jgi:hypothetical protein
MNIKQLLRVRGGKVLITICLLILTILMVFPILGYFQGELLGNIAFSFLPAGILINISIILACKVKNGSQKIAKAGWVSLSVAIVVFALLLVNPKLPTAGEEIGMIIAYPMAILSFPSCFVVAYFYYGISYLLDNLWPSGLINLGIINFYFSGFILWLGFFIAGYLQWFKLLPFIVEKWQSRRSHT